jgi:hypothetical protein
MLKVLSFDGRAYQTTRITSSDTATALPSALLTVAGYTAKGAIITVETASLRFAFGVDPTQGASGLGHMFRAGDTFRAYGESIVSQLKHINYAVGINAVIQVTILY